MFGAPHPPPPSFSPHQGQHRDLYRTSESAYLLPHVATRVQISGSQTGALHQMQCSLSDLALLDCRAASVAGFPISLSVAV